MSLTGVLPETHPDEHPGPAPSLFDRRAFAALARAMHPERRFPSAVSRLRVEELERQPDVATAWVYGAYATLLGRLPDPDGLRTHEAHLRGGGTPTDLVARLSASNEANDVAAETAVAFDDVFVTGAYLVALGRRPDSGGAADQRASLGAGVRHEEVLQNLLTSPEASRQLRFPPAPPSIDDHLARSVQELVAGNVDPTVHAQLVRGSRDGRSTLWLVRSAIAQRQGRRALVRAAPRLWWLAQLARHRAERELLVATVQASTSWNWRVQLKVFAELDTVQRDVATLKGRTRKGS